MRWDIDTRDGRRAKRTFRVAILYARFSPRPDRDRGKENGKESREARNAVTIERQFEDMREWCHKAGYEIAGEFKDAEVSGGESLEDRPGLSMALASMKSKYTLLVRSYDRFFRDSLQGLSLIGALEKKRCRVVSITEPMGSWGDPYADLVRTILLAVAEMQRKVSALRTKHRMRKNQFNGQRQSAAPPFGWRVDPMDKTRLVVNPDEIGIVEQIRTMRFDRDMSIMQITRDLNRLGRPCRNAKRWHHTQVKRIIERMAVGSGDSY